MTDVKEDGYQLEGRVSIGGKKYSAFTTKTTFLRPDGKYVDVATLFVRYPPKAGGSRGVARSSRECASGALWWADNESENGQYGVYEVREDGEPGATVAVVSSIKEANRLVREHNGRTRSSGSRGVARSGRLASSQEPWRLKTPAERDDIVNPNEASYRQFNDLTLYRVRLDDRGDLCVFVWADHADDALTLAEQYAQKKRWEVREQDASVYETSDETARETVYARSIEAYSE